MDPIFKDILDIVQKTRPHEGKERCKGLGKCEGCGYSVILRMNLDIELGAKFIRDHTGLVVFIGGDGIFGLPAIRGKLRK